MSIAEEISRQIYAKKYGSLSHLSKERKEKEKESGVILSSVRPRKVVFAESQRRDSRSLNGRRRRERGRYSLVSLSVDTLTPQTEARARYKNNVRTCPTIFLYGYFFLRNNVNTQFFNNNICKMKVLVLVQSQKSSTSRVPGRQLGNVLAANVLHLEKLVGNFPQTIWPLEIIFRLSSRAKQASESGRVDLMELWPDGKNYSSGNHHGFGSSVSFSARKRERKE